MKYISSILVVVLAGCATQKLKVEPVKVEPIHMTIDVNLHSLEKPGSR